MARTGSLGLVGLLACACSCLATEAELASSAWARFATTGRNITAPVDVGDGVVVGITTRGAGALVSERGDIVEALAGSDGGDAQCVLVRIDDDGRVLWQTPVVAAGAQTRCISLAPAHDGGVDARGETFDVDESVVTVASGDVATTIDDDDDWSVRVDHDGLIDELDAIARMDACTPTLAALSAALELDFDVDFATGAERIRSQGVSAGYFDVKGEARDVRALVAPQGALLDDVVVPAVDPSEIESVATVLSRRQ